MSCAISKFRPWDVKDEENRLKESKSIVPETEYRTYGGKQSMKKEEEHDILL